MYVITYYIMWIIIGAILYKLGAGILETAIIYLSICVLLSLRIMIFEKDLEGEKNGS